MPLPSTSMACGAWLPDGLSSVNVTLPALALTFFGSKENGVAPPSTAPIFRSPPALEPPPDAGVEVVSAGGAAAGVDSEDDEALSSLSSPQAATNTRQAAPRRSGSSRRRERVMGPPGSKSGRSLKTPPAADPSAGRESSQAGRVACSSRKTNEA